MYVAFVDFRKAYDCINRDILWSCLKHMGVTESALSLIRSMYDCVAFRIRIQGALGPIFYSSIGVNQGDPLYPLLFSLLIDRSEEFLEKECPHIGVHLRNQIIRLLLYADDLALMAAKYWDHSSRVILLFWEQPVALKQDQKDLGNRRNCVCRS